MSVLRLMNKRSAEVEPDTEGESLPVPGPGFGVSPRPAVVTFQSRWEEPSDDSIETEAEETPPRNYPRWVVVPWTILYGIYLAIRTIVFAVALSIRTVCRYLYRHPIHAVINVLFVLVLFTLISTGSELHKQMILSKISSEAVDKIIAGSRFTRDFDAEEINRGGVRELLRAGAPLWTQRESVRAILYQARKAGLGIEDQAVLLAIADVESGFNPMARASTTTACGLFQFVRRTGEIFSLSTSECMDPWLNAESGVQHYIYNFERRVHADVENLSGAERVFRTFELSYYMHHDGPQYGEPSSEVKAIVLNGSKFLFKAYHVLLNEAESQQHVPAFSETLSAKVWQSLDDAGTFFEGLNIPGLQMLHAQAQEHTPEAAS